MDRFNLETCTIQINDDDDYYYRYYYKSTQKGDFRKATHYHCADGKLTWPHCSALVAVWRCLPLSATGLGGNGSSMSAIDPSH